MGVVGVEQGVEKDKKDLGGRSEGVGREEWGWGRERSESGGGGDGLEGMGKRGYGAQKGRGVRK